MLTARAGGDWSGSVREEFLTLMCSDAELLGLAFDTIVAEQRDNHDANATKGDATASIRRVTARPDCHIHNAASVPTAGRIAHQASQQAVQQAARDRGPGRAPGPRSD